MRTRIVLLLTMFITRLPAQDILFLPTACKAREFYRQEEPQFIGHCTDSLRIDTIYIENAATGEMEMSVQTYPLARYEFYPDGVMYRRIDVAERYVRTDAMMTENLLTGEVAVLISEVMDDVPNGAYHEFFTNGNIRIKGTLDGYHADGSLKKTGEWLEWDATGKVIRQEFHP